MTKRNKWKPARFIGGHGVAYHGGTKPLPKPKTKKNPPSSLPTPKAADQPQG